MRYLTGLSFLLFFIITGCGKNHYLVQDPSDGFGNKLQTTSLGGGGLTGGNSGGGNSGGGNTGGSGQSMTENFVQNQAQQKKVDFLWVIDNSGSMAQEQQNLADNFSLFIQEFLTRDVDFKMGITTTDTKNSDKCGKMVPGADTKLTSDKAKQNEAQFITDFENLIKVGTGGWGQEKGLKASECFINKHNTNFLRPDAYLAVIYVSDEQDQSPETEAYYLEKLQSIKANAGLIKAYSIVNMQGLTFGQDLTLGYDRYDYVSTQSGGSTHDIFSSFAQSLVEIGDQIINLLESFPLQHEPITGTVVVKVNGALKNLNQDYVIENRAVKFLNGSIPSPSASISVEYQY